MGNSAIYYYPDPDGTLETIDLGCSLSDLAEIPLRQIGQGVSLLGYPSTHVYSGSFRVRVECRYLQSASVARKLLSLSAHLERGGRIGVAYDTAKTYGSRLNKTTRGVTTALLAGDLWYASGSLSAGDEVVIESGNPDMLREWATVDSVSGSVLTLSAGATYTMSGKPYIRHRNFYPALYWPADQRGSPIITGPEGRRWYDLDMTLEVDWSVMDATEGQTWRTATDRGVAESLETVAKKRTTSTYQTSIQSLIGEPVGINKPNLTKRGS